MALFAYAKPNDFNAWSVSNSSLLTKCMISLLYACREKQLEEEDCAKKVEGLRAAAKKAKSTYSKLKTVRGIMCIGKI